MSELTPGFAETERERFRTIDRAAAGLSTDTLTNPPVYPDKEAVRRSLAYTEAKIEHELQEARASIAAQEVSHYSKKLTRLNESLARIRQLMVENPELFYRADETYLNQREYVQRKLAEAKAILLDAREKLSDVRASA